MRIFVSYDFKLPPLFRDKLTAVRKKLPPDWELIVPGVGQDPDFGAIWRDIVAPGIQRCDRLLCFVDTANVNVGFEIGYGIGLGKEFVFPHFNQSAPTWMEKPPLHGFAYYQIHEVEKLTALVQADGDKWSRLDQVPEPGTKCLFLAPHVLGDAYRELRPSEWDELPKEGWDLHDLPRLLSGIKRVVWILVTPMNSAAERDGDENTALSVVAGFAEAHKIELHVLIRNDFRKLGDIWMRRSPFEDSDHLSELLQGLDAKFRAEDELAAPPTATLPALAPERPAAIPLLPYDVNDLRTVRVQFTGRELQLSDFRAAVDGLLKRFRGELPRHGEAVQLMWLHGFGGMGKSWFLQNAYLEVITPQRSATPPIKVLWIEWDKPRLREPLINEPRNVSEIYDLIALRIAQLHSIEAADPYWLAKARVRRWAERAARLRDSFDEELEAVGRRPDWVGRRMRELLESEHWNLSDSDRCEQRKRELRLPDHEPRLRQLFESWCDEQRHTLEDADAVIHPAAVLVSGLRETLRQACRQSPLLMLLDTCEVLNSTLDRGLRALLSMVCDGQIPLLVLIGSRLAPDADVRPGDPSGWKADMHGHVFRVVAFDEQVRFSVPEIAAWLQKSDPKLALLDELPARLHQATLGVPLALATLLQMHRQGADVVSQLQSHEHDDRHPDDLDAVKRVIEEVAHRLLLHLIQRPAAERDLSDIVALALLRPDDRDTLRAYWLPENLRTRLRLLASRYALISGDNLHATVRDYLRRCWHDPDVERPACFDSVLTRLEQLVAARNPSENVDREPQGASRGFRIDSEPAASALPLTQFNSRYDISEELLARMERLNLIAWRKGEPAYADFAPSIAVALAHDVQLPPLIALAAEIRPATKSKAPASFAQALRRTHEDLIQFRSLTDDTFRNLVASLDRFVAPSAWTITEQLCLTLCRALAAPYGTREQAEKAFEQLDGACRRFEAQSQSLPNIDRLASRFEDVATAQWQTYPNASVGWDCVLAASDRAIVLGRKNSNCLFHRGVALLQLNLHKEAESAFRSSLDLEPNAAHVHTSLGNLLRALSRPAEAEQSFRRAVELDPKSAYPHHGLGHLLRDLSRPAEAEQSFRRAIELDPKYAQPYNELAWLRVVTNGDLNEAERFAATAIELKPNVSAILHTYLTIRIRRGAWKAEQTRFHDWLRMVDAKWLNTGHNYAVSLFRDVIQQGHREELLALLNAEDLPLWKPCWQALVEIQEQRVPRQPPDSAEVVALYQALSTA